MTDETKPHLGGEGDAPSIFDNLEKLKADSALPPRSPSSPPTKRKRPERRDRITEPFAPMPYGRARKIFNQIGGPAWFLLVEIDRLIFESGGFNPVHLTAKALEGSGLTRKQVERGLRLLEQTETVLVERRRGRCPLVALLWYDLKK